MLEKMFKLNLRKIILLLFFVTILSACQQQQTRSIIQQGNRLSTVTAKQLKQQLQKTPPNFAAHWLTPQLLLLPKNNTREYYSLIKKTVNGLTSSPLTSTTFPNKLKIKFPYLANFQAFKVQLTTAKVKQWLKQQLIVVAQNKQGVIVHSNYVQIAALLDQLYTQKTNDANEATDLGATLNRKGVNFKLWAPTALNVQLLLFNHDKTPATPSNIVMTEDKHSGIWHVQTNKKFNAAFYQYQLTLYQPTVQKVVTVTVTDPYSLSLSTNGKYSQVADLNSAVTQPKGWLTQRRPTLKNAEDNIIYEVDIRDFSANDPQLSDKRARGKYKAFSEKNSASIKQLKALQAAGLTTIELMPSYDFSTVNEDPSKSIDINDNLTKVCKIAPHTSVCAKPYNKKQTIKSILNSYATDKSGIKAQQLVSELRSFDNYNWGYDPFHYTVPEGSYAINPEGVARLIAFRTMIEHLHNLGFKIFMDVVYNHTYQAGLKKYSVLDKIVPNYYQRLDPITGKIEHSTCCENTATEHVMMAKLMTDSLVTWARDYFIDGFRFDLMGHQPKAVMLAARRAVRKVDPNTYFYGEGWNFGEVANNQRFVQASQLELGGTEIGTYSDRLRDAVRGSGIGNSGNKLRQAQGLGNGLGTIVNDLNRPSTLNTTKANNHTYALLKDQARIGLTGNLANYPLLNSEGKHVLGKDIPYGNQPTGYALDPADTINYVSKHDNQTLWDNNQYRTAYRVSSDERVRMQLQSLAFTLFAQGIPFMQMGVELLRSKSFLRDSFNYGDWFNRVDFTEHTNYYDSGLPPAAKDAANWPLIKTLLKKNQGRDHVNAVQIRFSNAVFKEMLQIRTSSSLFKLTSAHAIIHQLSFLNTGAHQQSGLIVMKLNATLPIQKTNISTRKNIYKSIIVIFNTSAKNQQFNYAQANRYKLHPIQKNGVDDIVKQSKATELSFNVPALTTSVFVENAFDD